MKLWKIERQGKGGYDTFDMAVVAAETIEDARNTSPDGWSWYVRGKGWIRARTGEVDRHGGHGWTSPECVTVTKIGSAIQGTERGVIVASFNAG